MDIDGLRLIPNLDVKLLGVAGFHGPRDLAAILQGDDIGEEPVAGQQAEMPEDEQQDSSHNHTPDSRFSSMRNGRPPKPKTSVLPPQPVHVVEANLGAT